MMTNIVFPWRFLSLAVFASSILGAFLLSKIRFPLIGVLLIITTIFVSRHFWGWSGSIPTDDSFYQNYQETTTADGEFTPIGVSDKLAEYAQEKIEVIDGEAIVSNSGISFFRWQFATDVTEQAKIKLAILNFPGWMLYVDGQGREIIGNLKVANCDCFGLVVVEVPKGKHFVEVRFGETPLRSFANYVSLASILFLILFLLLSVKLNFTRMWLWLKRI